MFSRSFIIFTLISVVLFGLFPQIDLEVSRFFYRSSEGFYLRDLWLFHFLYRYVALLLGIPLLVLIGLFLYQFFSKKEFKHLNRRAIAFMLSALLIGPGIVTNLFLKEHYGRARPVHVSEFGGEKHFTPFYQPTDQCAHNCSFVSGHVSAALFFLTFAFVYRSKKLLWLALAFSALMALTRVVQGAHFLSDVLFAFIINYAIFVWLYKLFFREVPRFE
ncbi:MAG: hypothetical protein B6D59_03625 [Campylobacteraceae bacterium 4484_4]|nr:MAG: hypothetical protein B6D59_03625 [Campylobacteraceae bacterium 4484_4]